MLLLHESRWGRSLPAAEDPKREQYKSKADIVAFVKKAFADGAAAIQAKGEKGLMTEVVYFPQQKSRVLDIAYGIIEHSGEHYGQLLCTTVCGSCAAGVAAQEVKLKFDPSIFHRGSMSALSPMHSSRCSLIEIPDFEFVANHGQTGR